MTSHKRVGLVVPLPVSSLLGSPGNAEQTQMRDLIMPMRRACVIIGKGVVKSLGHERGNTPIEQKGRHTSSGSTALN